jgi:hypothetical protein
MEQPKSLRSEESKSGEHACKETTAGRKGKNNTFNLPLENAFSEKLLIASGSWSQLT